MAASVASEYNQYLSELDSTSAQNSGSKVKEANWLMSFQSADGASLGLTASQIKGFENFCFIYDLSFMINRGIEQPAGDSIKPDGGLIAEALKIVAPSSFIDADINLYFYQNTMIPQIVLQRVVSLNSPEAPTPKESYIFTNCFITSMLTRKDILAISFRYSSVQRETSILKAEDGSSEGKKSAKHSFITAMSAKESGNE